MSSLSRSLVFLSIIIVVGGIFLFGYHSGFKNPPAPPADLQSPSPTTSPSAPLPTGTSTATTTAAATSAGTSSPADTLLASSTSDVSAWKTYGNDELGVEFAYPADLVINEQGTSVALAFPKNGYFHWPLLDDAKITVSALTSCPSWFQSGEVSPSKPASTTVNGYGLTYLEGSEGAAGNIYLQYEFHLQAKQACYVINLFDHGTNGASLYVDDRTLVKKYDDQHEVDINAVKAVFAGLVKSFQVRTQPPGVPEDARSQ
ncbi:MAG: hypothetical protein QOG91_37 [Candidatus Parcubacteria bacterium]|jgi:hypothetical protein|nr:hypothetical protein [Candidatus Parcubacteria bacterium]